MRLAGAQARSRLASADHGILGTRHAERGVDAVPVVFALSDSNLLGVPIDQVKPKSTTRLQRQRNLEADPRAMLVVEYWDPLDWDRLWWVRAELRWQPDCGEAARAELTELLATRYRQYRDRPFAGLLVFSVRDLTGWAASPIPRDR